MKIKRKSWLLTLVLSIQLWLPWIIGSVSVAKTFGQVSAVIINPMEIFVREETDFYQFRPRNAESVPEQSTLIRDSGGIFWVLGEPNTNVIITVGERMFIVSFNSNRESGTDFLRLLGSVIMGEEGFPLVLIHF